MSIVEVMDLAGFLAARLDEDEAVAKAAEGRPEFDGTGIVIQRGQGGDRSVVMPSHVATHIARNDPGRRLREVAADRKLLALWEDPAWVEDPRKHPDSAWKPGDFWQDGRDQDEIELQVAVAQTIDDMIRIRAAVHSDHPDYRDDWKP